MEDGKLQQKMQELVDRMTLVDMVSRLGRWLDEKGFDDPAANAALFMPDLVLETPGGTAQGIEDVAAQARRRHSDARTQHVHTNVLIDLDGDAATAEANLIVTFVPNGRPATDFYQVGTRYRFTFKRTGEGWRFASIRDRQIWRSNPPA